MNSSSQEKPQLKMVVIMTLCMAVTIWIISTALTAVNQKFVEQNENQMLLGHGEHLPSEAGMFKGLNNFARFGEFSVVGARERTLDKTYERRMYYGAPPQIPHRVEEDFSKNQMNCLTCHGQGGYVKDFNSYAPVAPHPEYKNCRQCHVPQNASGVFKATQWASFSPPKTNQRQLAGGPPAMPHPLVMRENCLSCHGGPSAAREIRVTHPERVNCRQCHVEKQSAQTFESSFGKTLASGGSK